MFSLSKEKTLRLLGIHGWGGAVLGLLLYVVLFTGAVVVFWHEIGAWSVSGVKTHRTFDSMDAPLQSVAATVPEKFLDDVDIFHDIAGNIVAYFHTHEKNEKTGDIVEKGVRVVIDPLSQAVLQQDSGSREDLPALSVNGLRDFITGLHIDLHLPAPWGLYLTGIFGLLLLVSAISGFILHRHLLKDLFLAPRFSNRLLNARDRHNLAGTWSLPFAFVLAMTGAFFSFATSVSIYVIAATAFGGDMEKAFSTLIGQADIAESRVAAPITNFDKVMADFRVRSSTPPSFIMVSHWGKENSKIQIFPESSNHGALGIETQYYDGVSGDYLGVKPGFGQVPSAGDAIFGVFRSLHFGDFSGLISKFLWLLLGFLLCYVTLNGIDLWLIRRQESVGWRRFSWLVPTVGYGLPIGITGAAIGFLLSAGQLSAYDWTFNGFWWGSGLSLALLFVVRSRAALEVSLRFVLGGMLLLLPCIRVGLGGADWSIALGLRSMSVIMMDVAWLSIGQGYLIYALRSYMENYRSAHCIQPGDTKEAVCS